MKEHNKKSLIESLSSLPEYEPPAHVWETIEQALSSEPNEILSSKNLPALPVYEPPVEIWENLSRRLDTEKNPLLAISWKKALTVAASLALLLFAVWQLTPATVPVDNFRISYSEETVDPLLLHNDWDEDEEAFQEFLEICLEKKYICERPEFVQLQSELQELTLAKEEIKSAIGGYGATPQLVAQIKEIELERTDILKKLMVMLI